MDPLLTPKEVAKFLNVKQATIYKWLDEGKFGDAVRIISKGPRKRTPRFILEKIKELFKI